VDFRSLTATLVLEDGPHHHSRMTLVTCIVIYSCA
jgi:hypothetical protein